MSADEDEEDNDITPDEIDWSQLKFQAKFQVGEDARSYHLGLKKKKLNFKF